MEYTGLNEDQLVVMAQTYNFLNFSRFKNYADPRDYYKSLGVEQLARQFWFHHQDQPVEQMEAILSIIDTNRNAYGCEFGCGSAPVSFELALRGHKIDFIDLDGTPAYEFTKWRAKKRGVRCGFELQGPYDYILLLDSIEHLKDWQADLGKLIVLLKEKGAIFTNYFLNRDFENVEHISMDHEAVKQFLTSQGVYPVNKMMWMKQDFSIVGKNQEAA